MKRYIQVWDEPGPDRRWWFWILIVLLMLPMTLMAGTDLISQAQEVMKAPDAAISGTFELPSNSVLTDRLLHSPLIVARLWEGYDFTPRYKVSLRGDCIHVDDPTGIQGDIYLVDQTPSRRVYFGTGALNHSLVPAFQGRMAIVMTMSPKGKGTSARINIYIRMESRVVGVLTRTFFPLVRSHAQHRMTANMQDLCTILQDVVTAPKQAAARLKNEQDAEALLQLVNLAPGTRIAARSPEKPATPTPNNQRKRSVKK